MSDVEALAVGNLGHHVEVEECGAEESKQDDEHRPSLITIGPTATPTTSRLFPAGEGSHGTVRPAETFIVVSGRSGMTAYPGGCLTAARVMGRCAPADLTGFQDGLTWANQATQITVATQLLEDCVEALSWPRLPRDTLLVLRHTMDAFKLMFQF